VITDTDGTKTNFLWQLIAGKGIKTEANTKKHGCTAAAKQIVSHVKSVNNTLQNNHEL